MQAGTAQRPAATEPERLRRLNALLEKALDLTQETRAAWLASLPAPDQALAPQLGRLLARAAASTDDFMRRPARLALHDSDEPADAPGDRIGPYRLVHELGRGGMACVWLAERCDGALVREVALKLPLGGLASGLPRRMARERDILASLEHPLIARLYDAGVTPEGRPWLAMERVHGTPIDVYCQSGRLSVRARLALFLQVADAVAYAHGRLVVHRDLKPANILVTPQGEVRLLDFGVASLLGDAAGPPGMHTQTLSRAATPGYASPEQLGGRTVTVATDVYSLGVVLYELLTGVRPYRLGRDSTVALEEAILAADVPPASTRVAHDPRLARQLRGDLDTILAMALRKQPAQRYASVESLAADVRRHLNGEPVHAQAPRWHYHLAKFARRNQFALAACAGVGVAVLTGLGTALWQAGEAARERELAYARLAQTEAVSEFMHAVLAESIQYDERITLKELVARSEAIAQSAGQPTERAVAANAVANWHLAFGDHGRAQRLLSQTLRSLPQGFDGRLQRILQCQRARAMALGGAVQAALQEIAQALDGAQDDGAAIARCLHMRAIVHRHALDARAALADMQESLRLFEEAVPRGAPAQRATLLGELANAWSLTGQAAQADALFARAMALLAANGRSDSHLAMRMRNDWAVALLHAGDPEQALRLLDEAQAIAARRAPLATQPAFLLGHRGRALLALGRHAEAESVYARMQDAAQQQDDAELGAAARIGRAQAALQRGEPAAVQPLLDQARRMLPTKEEGATSLSLAHTQALLWQARGQAREALAAWTALAAHAQERGLYLDILVHALTTLAHSDAGQGHLPQAQARVERAMAVARAVQGGRPHASVTGQAWLAVGSLRDARGQHAAARAAYLQAREHLTHTLGAAHPLALLAQERAGL